MAYLESLNFTGFVLCGHAFWSFCGGKPLYQDYLSIFLTFVKVVRVVRSQLSLNLKVASSHKVFHFGSNLQKWGPNHDPEHVFFKLIVLRIIIWHPFLKIWAKFKKLSEIKPPFPTSMESDENIGGCNVDFVTRNLIMKGGPRDF